MISRQQTFGIVTASLAIALGLLITSFNSAGWHLFLVGFALASLAFAQILSKNITDKLASSENPSEIISPNLPSMSR